MALASNETVVDEEMSSRGGAWMAMVGIGSAARVIENVTVEDTVFRKLETVSMISKDAPPSSSCARSKGEAVLPPRASSRACTK